MLKRSRTAWALLPLLMAGLHLGPGQRFLARDRAAEAAANAHAHSQAERHHEAIADLVRAQACLPDDDCRARGVLAFAEAQALIDSGALPQASERLQALLDSAEVADPALEQAARAALGTAQYHTAWLMRLEGATADEWLPESEAAREHFRFLAEQEQGEAALVFRRNLEAVLRLQAMDLSELQGLPLPKDCQNCKNACRQKRRQRESRSQQPGRNETQRPEMQDVRKEQASSQDAGLHPLPDGKGW